LLVCRLAAAAPLAKGARLSALHWRRSCLGGGPRFLPAGSGQSASSWQGSVVTPGGAPPPPECELAKLARRRRTGRHRNLPGAVHRRFLRDRISDPKPPIRSAFRIASRWRPSKSRVTRPYAYVPSVSRIIFQPRPLFRPHPEERPAVAPQGEVNGAALTDARRWWATLRFCPPYARWLRSSGD
jgi:hypothetical protein